MSAWKASLKKTEYLAYAKSVSYVMQAKSEGQGILARLDSKPDRVQSILGGAFLRMYLDGEVDLDVVAQAGEEIGQSTEFKRLSAELEAHLQITIDQLKIHTIDQTKLAQMADKYLKLVKAKRGIAFRSTLNAVIGGVTDVVVKSATYLREVGTRNKPASVFRFEITFYDVYDFKNKRRGEYDRYRRELAEFLLANDFENFEELYEREAHHPFDKKVHKTKLDLASVFASYMYALEKKGWTSGGLAWNVTVPTELVLSAAARH